jgi:hypothetical protein
LKAYDGLILGKNGKAMLFDGDGDYIEINGEATKNLKDTKGLTVLVWVKKYDSCVVEGFLGRWYTAPAVSNSFLLYNGEETSKEGNFLDKGCFVVEINHSGTVNYLQVEGKKVIPVKKYVLLGSV